MNKKIVRIIKERELRGLITAVLTRIYIRRAKCYPTVKRTVCCDNGLEIDGPSPVPQKKSILPIYNYIHGLDNCNFFHRTVWKGEINKGLSYDYSKQHDPGQQFLLEAIAPLHILLIGQKPQKEIIPDNRSLSDHLHSYKWKTPFTSDKI